jgi:deoxyadenosine/deoxycytidine kinase
MIRILFEIIVMQSSNRNTGIFIGFIGVPGVGKSTIATALAKQLDAQLFIEPGEESYPIDHHQPWQNQVAILENWVCETNLKNFEDARRLADAGNISIADGGIFLVNQELMDSPAYSWWYGLIPQEEKNKIYQISRHDWFNAPSPDVLVLFEANTETWLRFLKQRARKTDEDAEKNLNTYLDQQKVMAEAAEKFANSRKINFIKFNNEYGSPEKSAALLYDILNKNNFVNKKSSDINYDRFFGCYKNYTGELENIPDDSILNAPVEDDGKNIVIKKIFN